MVLIKGDVVYSISPDRIVEGKDCFLGFEDGRITGIYESIPEGRHEVLDRTGCLVIPGLVDLHLHAPQYQYAGLYMDEELLSWLERHTFPEEAKYRSLDYADKAYDILVDDLKRSETTRAAIFGTVFKDSTLLLMKKLSKAGIRGFVGKVNMDRNSPDSLQEDSDRSLKDTLDFLQEAEGIEGVLPIITPRFIPSCTDSLLEKLGLLVKERNIPVQSHLDENLSEIEWVRELCPESRNYSDAYDRFGLFGSSSNTIMAHVVWPDEEELDLMKNRKVWVAHSPSSNGNLKSGIAPVRRFLSEGIHTGLATDVAGGSTLSMFRILTESIEMSKIRWRLQDDSLPPLTFAEAFYLATRAGGSFFGKVGAFEKDYEADILVLDAPRMRSTLLEELSPSEKLEFYAHRCPGALIRDKFISGVKIL